MVWCPPQIKIPLKVPKFKRRVESLTHVQSRTHAHATMRYESKDTQSGGCATAKRKWCCWWCDGLCWNLKNEVWFYEDHFTVKKKKNLHGRGKFDCLHKKMFNPSRSLDACLVIVSKQMLPNMNKKDRKKINSNVRNPISHLEQTQECQ